MDKDIERVFMEDELVDCLKIARSKYRSDDVSDDIFRIKRSMKVLGIHPKEAMTSERELERMLLTGHKASAIHWLGMVRNSRKHQTKKADIAFILFY